MENDPLERAVGRLEGKIDRVIASLDALPETLAKYDERLDKIENDASYWRAIMAVAAFVIATAVPVALKYMGLA